MLGGGVGVGLEGVGVGKLEIKIINENKKFINNLEGNIFRSLI